MEQGIGSSEPRRRGSQTRPSAHPLPGTGGARAWGGIAGSSLDAIGDAHVPLMVSIHCPVGWVAVGARAAEFGLWGREGCKCERMRRRTPLSMSTLVSNAKLLPPERHATIIMLRFRGLVTGNV